MKPLPRSKPLPPESLQPLLLHRARFLAFLEKRVGSKGDAEDILQSAFARALERGGGIRTGESAVFWFYRVLRNAVVDYYRHKAAGSRLVESWAEDLELLPAAQGSVKQEICRCLSGVVAALKSEYRQAIELVDLEEGSLQDLARQAGISPNNAAVRIHRARRALRQAIELACGACVVHGCLDCQCRSPH
ncbi:MAG: sigma-70 family RNA polymerase sigma factor [Acidobacteriota bacterium]